jgi:hypothetical protein
MPAPFRTPRPPIAALAACVTLLCQAHPVAAQSSRVPAFVPRVLIDRELKSRPIKLAGFDSRSIQILDIGGLIRHEPIESALAIVTAGPVTQATTLEDRLANVTVAELPGALPWAPGDAARPDLLTLVDGQRLSGRPDGREADPEQFITWIHPTFGALRFPIERVKRIDVGPASPFSLPAQPRSKDDQLLLANGDRLSGFIAALSDPLRLEVDKKPVSLPWQRISAAFFAASSEPPAGTMIWLADGTVLRAEALAPASGKLVRVTPWTSPAPKSENPADASPTEIPLGAIASIAFDASRLASLSGLPATDPAGQSRDVRVDPGLDQPLGAGTIEFTRPAAAAWSLPKGASRLAFTADLPPDCWSWGDCELVVTLAPAAASSATAPREIFRRRMNADAASIDVNLPIDAPANATLTIRIDEGLFGPIQDRVVLRRGLLLVSGTAR